MHYERTLAVLRTKLRAFSLFAAASFAASWGAFYLLTLPPDTIPRELVWLGIAVATASTLAFAALLFLSARARRHGR
jgi:hypothetical protein